MVQWLKPHAFTVGGINSIPGLDPRFHLQLGVAKKKKKKVFGRRWGGEREGERRREQ